MNEEEIKDYIRKSLALPKDCCDWKVDLAKALVGKLSTPRLTEEIEKAVEHRTDIIQSCLKDLCDDDTEIRTMAKEVLTEYEVEGDSYGVPCLTDVVRLVVDKAKPRLTDWEKVLPKKNILPLELQNCWMEIFRTQQNLTPLFNEIRNWVIDDCIKSLKSMSEPRLMEEEKT
jgi:hypothetical protein